MYFYITALSNILGTTYARHQIDALLGFSLGAILGATLGPNLT